MSRTSLNDNLFFTRFNFTHRPLQSIQKISSSLNRPILQKRQKLQSIYENYNLFKYSKAFSIRRRYSVKNINSLQKINNNHNYKTIKREGQKLKERLNVMQKDRKLLLQKLKLQQK